MKIRTEKYRSYTIGSSIPLGDEDLNRLVDIFEHPSDKKADILEGRGVPRNTSLPESGPVVIKSYRRGGWISLVNRETYVRTFKTRPRKEFDFLLCAAEAGVPVPTPVAFATRGRLFYQAWLITRDLTGSVSYARLCLDEKDRALSLLPEISRHIRRLIQKKIFHVDLHPGNILVDKKDKPYIIDFDKARYFLLPRFVLAGKYRRRWKKAVRKYRLPEVFADLRLTGVDR